MTIRIVTDSACDLPQDVCDRLGIVVVPLSIRFG
ncbi:MAG: DegV family protein, partial [Actinomycetota bacterium]